MRLLIECGAAETRAALVRDDHVVGLWFGPARGDEAAPAPPRAGEIWRARVRAVAKGAMSAFVDLGIGPEALVNLKKSDTPLTEGEDVLVQIRRAAEAGKGPIASLDWTAAKSEAILLRADNFDGPGRIDPVHDAIVQALLHFGADGVDLVEVDDHEAAMAVALGCLRADITPPELDMRSEADGFPEIDEAVDAALERTVPLAAGARMIFDETEALVAVDIDAGGAFDGPRPLADRVNVASAARLFDELALRGVGGQVVVDFLPPGGAKGRDALIAALKDGAAAAGGKFGRLNRDGLADFTLPRRGPSMAMAMSEPAGAGWLRAGRRLTVARLARDAVRALDRALRAEPSVQARLVVSPAVAAHIAEHPQWTERLAEKRGARFRVETHAKEREHIDVATR